MSGILNQLIQGSFTFLSVVILFRPVSVPLAQDGIRCSLVALGWRPVLILVHGTVGSDPGTRGFAEWSGLVAAGCGYRCTAYQVAGTEGRTRTDTGLPQPDFESGASTNFATPARSLQ